jgi:predicted dehydrogenase
MSTSEIRLALVGCPGSADAYRDIAMRLQGGCITVVVETDVALGRSVAEAVGASVVVDSLETALREQDTALDAVVIRMPLPQRQAAARLAAEARKHVFVEAPIAASVSATEAIIDACTRAGVCLAIGGTLRFLPSSQTIMGRLSDGKLGVPGLLRVHRWQGADSRFRRPLADVLFADIDMALWLFGAKPTDVYALSRKGAQHAGSAEATPEYVQVHFGFPSGGMAILDFSTALPAGEGYESLSLIGSSGAAYADDHHNTHLLYRGGNPAALISGQGHLHVVREHQAFVDAIIEKTPPRVTGEECLAAHQVMDAVLRSLDSGQVLHEQEDGYEPAPGN